MQVVEGEWTSSASASVTSWGCIACSSGSRRAPRPSGSSRLLLAQRVRTDAASLARARRWTSAASGQPTRATSPGEAVRRRPEPTRKPQGPGEKHHGSPPRIQELCRLRARGAAARHAHRLVGRRDRCARGDQELDFDVDPFEASLWEAEQEAAEEDSDEEELESLPRTSTSCAALPGHLAETPRGCLHGGLLFLPSLSASASLGRRSER